MIYRTMRGRTFNYIELATKLGEANALYVGHNKNNTKNEGETKKETTKVSLSNYNMKNFLQGKTLKEQKVPQKEEKKFSRRKSRQNKTNDTE